MSCIDPRTSHSEAAISAALREFARSGPQSAPTELGAALAVAFHRHHAKRRIARTASALALALVVAVGLFWPRTRAASAPAAKLQPILTRDSGLQPAVSTDATSAPSPRTMVVPRRNRQLRASTKSNRAAGDKALFIALPSFAFETAHEELRIIRVEMPASSLRLLGAHVNDEPTTGRVITDLLVGSDGTPYAFRLVT